MVEQRSNGRGSSKGKKMKILVALDNSKGSLYALSWAIDHLVTAGSGVPEQVGSLVLLHVQQPFVHYMLPVGPDVYPTSSAIDTVSKAQELNSRHVVAQGLQICKERLVTAETLVTDGNPKDKICQVAEQMHADLLVVGSRGLGSFQRAFLGSVSDYCVHHAKCPVLIVRQPNVCG